jgi:peptidoglycan hydrolase-like protein with peptidoglycan-binding domain
MDIVKRSQWKAVAPKSVTKIPRSNRVGVAYHHTVTSIGTTPRQIQRMHMEDRGWSDIGYNYMITSAGRVIEGRGIDVQGAHSQGENRLWIGVAFIGDYRDGHDDLTDAAKDAADDLYAWLCDQVGHDLQVCGHQDLPGESTECPGDQVMRWIRGPHDDDGHDDDRAPTIVCPPTVERGDNGAKVRRLQALCNVAGARPALVVDGIFGDQTFRGVNNVQRQHKVTADGICGPVTWSILLGVR